MVADKRRHSKQSLRFITTSGEIHHGVDRHLEFSLKAISQPCLRYQVGILHANKFTIRKVPRYWNPPFFKFPDGSCHRVGKKDKSISQGWLEIFKPNSISRYVRCSLLYTTPFLKLSWNFLYRATLCYRGICSRRAVRLSVCPSVTCRHCIKTAKCRITQTTSYDSSGTLVFWRWKCRRNSIGLTPNGGAK